MSQPLSCSNTQRGCLACFEESMQPLPKLSHPERFFFRIIELNVERGSKKDQMKSKKLFGKVKSYLNSSNYGELLPLIQMKCFQNNFETAITEISTFVLKCNLYSSKEIDSGGSGKSKNQRKTELEQRIESLKELSFKRILEHLTVRPVFKIKTKRVVSFIDDYSKAYNAWQSRDLSGKEYRGISSDALRWKKNDDVNSLQVLAVVFGFLELEPKLVPEVLGIYTQEEKTFSWKWVLQDLKERGLNKNLDIAISHNTIEFWGDLRNEFPKPLSHITPKPLEYPRLQEV